MSMGLVFKGEIDALVKIPKGPATPRLTGHRSLSAALVELDRQELCRTGRLYWAGTTTIANGIAPVQAVPTTTAGWALYNNNPVMSGRCFVIDRACSWLGSGTAAAGATLLGAVTPQMVADANKVTANATGQ